MIRLRMDHVLFLQNLLGSSIDFSWRNNTHHLLLLRSETGLKWMKKRSRNKVNKIFLK